MAKRVWLLVAVLAACTDAHGPEHGTQTGNPPVLDRGRVTLEVSADEVHIVGKAGAASPGGASIEITNLSTGQAITGTAAADGSFDVRVDGSLDDAFVVRAVANGDESSPVYVVRGGAEIADGADGSLACNQYSELGRVMLEASAAAADRSCASDADCNATSVQAHCVPSCTHVYASIAGTAQVMATARALNDGLCASSKADGCSNQLVQCAAPAPVGCIAGQCAVTGDLSCTTCFTETLAWGMNGGLVAWEDVSEVVPCARYRHRRSPALDPAFEELSCERDIVACNHFVSTGAIMSALGHADVQAALTESPVLYGTDPRGVDGQLFRLKFGDKMIEVGGSCENAPPNCIPAPEGVVRLVELLQDIDEAMLMTEECAGFPKP